MIRNILSVALLSAFVVNADAWTPPNTPASVSASKSGAAGERFIEQNLFYLMAPPTDKEAFVDGAVTFTHAGRNYALKAIFSRAIFDPGMETYRTGLQYQLSDFTDPQNIVIWVPIDPAASPVKDFNNNSDGTDLHIVSGARYVEITAATNGKSQKYKFRRQDLLDNWESNALNYSQELGGYTWHFVPQVVWQPRGWGNY